MTIVVAIVVGLASGLITTLLSLSHDRAADLRTRMLDAADDFVAGFATARDAIQRAETRYSTIVWLLSLEDEDAINDAYRRELAQEQKEVRTAARQAYDEVQRREPRLRLLFGTDSLTVRAATMAHISLSRAVHALDMPVKEGDVAESKREDRARTSKAIDDFSRYARSAITESPWSWRRPWRQRTRARRAVRNWAGAAIRTPRR